jgi:hypothetical protein
MTTTGYLIRCIDWNAPFPCPVKGAYLEWYDPKADAWGGATVFGWTRDLEKAKAFPSMAEAADFYRQPLLDENDQPRRRRDRPGADPMTGGVERPLTAFSVDFPAFDDDGATGDVVPFGGKAIK